MRIYGQWAGNERGHREDPEKCIASVSSGFLFYQCSRKRGHGPDGLYCKQHGGMVERGRYVYVPEDRTTGETDG